MSLFWAMENPGYSPCWNLRRHNLSARKVPQIQRTMARGISLRGSLVNVLAAAVFAFQVTARASEENDIGTVEQFGISGSKKKKKKKLSKAAKAGIGIGESL